tara:strand:+ start:50 stop:208 length:159 start_codon:yes stop_codon:yes gene_type:complete
MKPGSGGPMPGILAIEEDEDVYYFRWGAQNIGLIGKQDTIKEVMEVLRDAQS